MAQSETVERILDAPSIVREKYFLKLIAAITSTAGVNLAAVNSTSVEKGPDQAVFSRSVSVSPASTVS